MGWKDAGRAYEFALPMAVKAALVAIAHATDDKSHQTYIGKRTIAARIGADPKTVQRALRDLVSERLISREERISNTGYRSTDLITFTPEQWVHKVPSTGDTKPPGQSVPRTDSPGSGDSVSQEWGHSVQAEEIIQIDHSGDHSDTSSVTFDDFWNAWPKKRAKKSAAVAWDSAITRANPQTIVNAAHAYAMSRDLPDPEYIPYAESWLMGDRWDDELDTAEANGQSAVETRCARDGHLELDDSHYCGRCGINLTEEAA